jgi:hypothetical protein
MTLVTVNRPMTLKTPRDHRRDGTFGDRWLEGPGSYGAGLFRSLDRAGIAVVEVDRPNRQVRHREGKSDPVDAVAAARAALSGRALGIRRAATETSLIPVGRAGLHRRPTRPLEGRRRRRATDERDRRRPSATSPLDSAVGRQSRTTLEPGWRVDSAAIFKPPRAPRRTVGDETRSVCPVRHDRKEAPMPRPRRRSWPT